MYKVTSDLGNRFSSHLWQNVVQNSNRPLLSDIIRLDVYVMLLTYATYCVTLLLGFQYEKRDMAWEKKKAPM